MQNPPLAAQPQHSHPFSFTHDTSRTTERALEMFQSSNRAALNDGVYALLNDGHIALLTALRLRYQAPILDYPFKH